MELSDFELDVMQYFWVEPEASAPQIHQLIKKRRAVSYSTVKTIIDRLENKGALKRSRQDGRKIYYKAAVTKQRLRKPMVKDFIKRVFLNDGTPLAAHIIKDEKLSLDDIEYLESLLEQKKRDLE